MRTVLFFYLLFLFSNFVSAEERLRLATTTSTDNSGLLEQLHPVFEQEYEVKIDVIAVGTGKALRLAENGDVDLVLVHAPVAEERFVAEGHGVERMPVMHNDFIILGPTADPAGLKQLTTATEGFLAIAKTKSGFISRGDDSGTHKKEMAIWQSAKQQPKGDWYMAAGQGMGAVLKIANDKQAYTLTDRGTYLAYKDKIDLIVAHEGDNILFNPYHVILVNPNKHPHVKHKLARQYSEYLTSEKGQSIIRNFRIQNEVLFHPDIIP